MLNRRTKASWKSNTRRKGIVVIIGAAESEVADATSPDADDASPCPTTANVDDPADPDPVDITGVTGVAAAAAAEDWVCMLSRCW